MEQCGLFGAAAARFALGRDADLRVARGLEQGHEFLRREMVRRVEDGALLVAGEIAVGLAGQTTIVGIEAGVAGVDRVGNTGRGEIEVPARPKVLVEVPEEVFPFANATDDREDQLADDDVERTAVNPGTLSR